MRTTIEINDKLLREAKQRANYEGTALRQVVEASLRLYLGNQSRTKGYRLKWRTEEGRIQAGVRLDDRDALFDIMEERD